MKTAIDWYWDKIKSHFEHDGDLLETAMFTFAIAKEKEKEQIMNAFISGRLCMDMYYVEIDWPEEQYYNETYKSE